MLITTLTICIFEAMDSVITHYNIPSSTFVGATATRSNDGRIKSTQTNEYSPFNIPTLELSKHHIRQPRHRLPLKMVMSNIISRENHVMSAETVENECHPSFENLFLKMDGPISSAQLAHPYSTHDKKKNKKPILVNKYIPVLPEAYSRNSRPLTLSRTLRYRNLGSQHSISNEDVLILGKHRETRGEMYNLVHSDKASPKILIPSVHLPTSPKLTSAINLLPTSQARPQTASSTPSIKSRFQYLYGAQISNNPGTMDTLNWAVDSQNNVSEQGISRHTMAQSNEKFNSIDIKHLSQPKSASRNEELFTSNSTVLFSDLDSQYQQSVPNFSSASFLHPVNSTNKPSVLLKDGHIPDSHEINDNEDKVYLPCSSTELSVPIINEYMTEYDKDNDSWGSTSTQFSSLESECSKSSNSSYSDKHSIWQSLSEQSETTASLEADDKPGNGSGRKCNSGIKWKVGLQECHQYAKKKKLMPYITSPDDVYGQDSQLLLVEEE